MILFFDRRRSIIAYRKFGACEVLSVGEGGESEW